MNYKFNDIFAVFLMVMFVVLWMTNRWVQLPDLVLGSITPMFILVVQFYFRKAPNNK